MKRVGKILCTLCITLFAFALCACSGIFALTDEDLDYASYAQSDKIEYVSITVNVITLYDSSSQTPFGSRLELVLPSGLFSSEQAGGLLAGLRGVNVESCYGYTITVDSQEDYWGYDYYDCFSFTCDTDLFSFSHENSEYGFFYLKHEYKHEVNYDFSQIKNDVCSRVKNAFTSLGLKPSNGKGAYDVDMDAVHVRYYFTSDVKFIADGAIEITKSVVDDSGILSAFGALMWELESGSDLSLIKIRRQSNAPGWFVVAIALGTITAAIIYFSAKGSNDENEFGSVSVEAVDLPEESDQAESECSQPIENQISIEDYMVANEKSEETNG